MALRKLAKAPARPPVDNDPRFPGYHLYPTGITYQGLPACSVQNTWYVLEAKTGRLVQMLSLGGDGIRRGWDHCGRCRSYFTTCVCPELQAPPWLQAGQAAPVTVGGVKALDAVDPEIVRRARERYTVPDPTPEPVATTAPLPAQASPKKLIKRVLPKVCRLPDCGCNGTPHDM